jgi:hypothetical protein
MYMPARAGPIALPIILRNVVIPRDNPLNCLGVDNMTTFIAQKLVSDNPVDKTARLTETNNSIEWKKSKLIKLALVIIVPSMTGFRDPNFETMYPEVGTKLVG